MCYRVTVVLPRSCNMNKIQEVSKEYDFSFNIIHNVSVLKQLSEDEVYLSSTDCGCECYTGIGAYELYHRDINSLLKGFHDKALIKITMEEDIQRKKTYKSEADNWLTLIKTLMHDYEVDWIGLLLHFYQSSSQEEEIIITNKVTQKISETDPEFLMKMDKDIIYYFEK